MKVLLQKNIWHEYGYDRFVQSFQDAGIDCEIVHIVPFTHEFDTKIDYVPDYVFGSTRFINICRQKGYPTFPSYNPVESYYPKQWWLNGDGLTAKWGDVYYLELDYPVFVKPYTEKFFTGMVVEQAGDFEKIQLATSFIKDEKEEFVRITPFVNIKEEVRYFVLGKNIITGSRYRLKGQVKHEAIDISRHDSYHLLWELLHNVGAIDEAFVIDFGLTDDGWKIVELNNFNSSGLYQSNTDAIVRALKIYHENKNQ